MRISSLSVLCVSLGAYLFSETAARSCNPQNPKCGRRLKKKYCKATSPTRGKCVRRLDAGETCDPNEPDPMQCFSKTCVSIAGENKCACLFNWNCRSQQPTMRLKNRAQCKDNVCVITSKDLARVEEGIALGQPCDSDLECVSGSCDTVCIASTYWKGKGGEACETNEGCHSGDCRSGTCACDRSRKKTAECVGEGAVCGGDGNCVSLKLGGESCSIDEECLSGGCEGSECTCQDGSNSVSCSDSSKYCDDVNGESFKLCANKLPASADCGRNKECLSNVCTNQDKCACVSDNECSGTGAFCNSGTCQVPVENGESCSVDQGCVSNNCDSGTCSCEPSDCVSGEYCSSRTHSCEVFVPVGDSCNWNEQCVSNSCSGGTCQCSQNSDCQGGSECSSGDCLLLEGEICNQDSECSDGTCNTPTGSSVKYCGLAPGGATCANANECISDVCNSRQSKCKCLSSEHCPFGTTCPDDNGYC